jgi:hypothetical protein
LASVSNWSAYVVDVQGAFLNGRFESGERFFLCTLNGFKYAKEDEESDKISDIGEKMSRTIELDEIEYTILILFIDVKTSNGKFAFKIVKGCKSIILM